MIGIVTDDNAGFPEQEAKRLGIQVIQMPIIINGQEYFENANLTSEEFYRLQASNADISTSQPTPGAVKSIWRKALESCDSLVHIPMSSGLSKSMSTAKIIADEDEFKGRVFVADNHRISVTLRDSVYDAIELAKQGRSAREIVDYLDRTGHDSRIYIYVDTLKYLKKGGRITPAAATMGQALHIKPVLKIEGGKLDAKAKALGSKKAQQDLIDFIEDDLHGTFKAATDKLSFAMAYTGGPADYLAACALRDRFAAAIGIPANHILLDRLSLSVAVHIGPGAIATTITEVISPKDIEAVAEREFHLV